MRIGIISEGKADIAVIVNILKGITGLDSSQFLPLQPKTSFDQTHLAHLDPDQKGGWSLVRKECLEKRKIDPFFSIEDNTHIVIHIDSAEAEDYPVTRPQKDYHQYCQVLREKVIEKIQEWLGKSFDDRILFAVAIEETEAWILVLFENSFSCQHVRPKERLQRVLQKQGENTTSNYENYLRLSKPFSKGKIVNDKRILALNCSLNSFYIEARSKLGI